MRIINLTEALTWEKEQDPKPNPKLRDAFDCEEASLNAFLSKFARQADEQNSARTWICLDKKQKRIAGYISLSNTSIEKEEASPTIKSYTNPIPALLIGRLAIDKDYKKQGLGEKLLIFGFEKAKELNTISAIQAIVVDTLNENAESFYKRYGFVKIGSSNKMIISTKNLFN
jgi:predicted GNAT family N-acyltransferase